MGDVAIVTGGSTGIGEAICKRLADEGMHVISLSRRKPPHHERIEGIEVDLTDPTATRQAALEIANRHAVTHIIHNAGAIRANPIAAVTNEDLEVLTQLHLGAPLALLQAVLPQWKDRKFGRMVLISSRAALGLPTRTAYSATKSGMLGMARAWALELAPEGVTVNVVAPGPIESTEMFHEVLPEGDPRIAALANAIPVRRLGTPQDVARAVTFFASRDASFVTGQVLYVCGGSSVGTIQI